MTKLSQFTSALMTLILGVLFVMLKGGVVGIAIKVFAAVLIITAVIELIKLKIASGVVKAILAVVLLIFGWAITEIALLCGFNSLNNFCKCYKKIMKMTPLAYRKQVKK